MQPVLIITGAGSGIGYDTALQMRRHGWRVFATARKAADVARLQSEGFDSVLLDVNSSDSIQQAFAHILQQSSGRLDGLFCNAGYGQPGAVEDLPRQALRRQFETNVFGVWECIHHAMPVFRRQNHGRILVNSSLLGFAAMPWRGAYNSSKFALEGMCDTLRHELHGSGISVSLVEPGPVTTRFRNNALPHFLAHIKPEHSVHREAYRKQVQRLSAHDAGTRFALSSPDCAAICCRAFTDARPKPRYRATLPSKCFWYLQKLLPTAWSDRLKRSAVRKQGTQS